MLVVFKDSPSSSNVAWFYVSQSYYSACPAGKFGKQCLLSCMPTYYGVQCKKLCNCTYSMTCDPARGCVCATGFTGSNCSNGMCIIYI